MAAKYDPDSEAEVISWFKQLFDVDLEAGMREMENQLRDGQLLVRYQSRIMAQGQGHETHVQGLVGPGGQGLQHGN